MNDSGIVATPLGLATFPFSPENCYGVSDLIRIICKQNGGSSYITVKKLIAKAKREMIQILNKNKQAYSTVRSNHLMEP